MSKFLPIIFILAAIGVILGYASPTYNGSIQSLRNDITELDRALATAEQFKRQQEALLTERNAIETKNLNDLETLLPDNVDNVELILDVDGIADDNGVRISDIGVETSSGESQGQGVSEASGPVRSIGADQTYDSLILSFSATGTYDQFKRFLTSLEQSLRTIDVVEVSFSSEDTSIYNFDVRARVYWLP